MAARFKVVILDQVSDPSGSQYRAALWADVPVARQAFWALTAPAASAWKDAIAGDNSQIVSGAVAEKVIQLRLAPGENLAAAKAAAQAASADWITFVTNYNPWNRYGSTYDGSVWAPAGAA